MASPLPLNEAHVVGDPSGRVLLENDMAHYINAMALGVLLTTVSSTSTVSSNQYTQASASAGTITLTLPTGAPGLTRIAVEKTDSTANAVSITGNIRAVGATTVSLTKQYESLEFIADANGSWWPVAGHKTMASLREIFSSRSTYSAADSGLLAWTFDPSCCDGGAVSVTSGRAYYGRIMVPETITVTNILYMLINTPTSLTASDSRVGLYDSSGNLIGQSADQSTLWTGAALKTTPLTGGPFTIVGGPGVWIEAALLSVGTGTMPQFRRGSGSGDDQVLNAGLAKPPYRVSQSTSAALTTLAGSKPTVAGTGYNIWFGLS